MITDEQLAELEAKARAARASEWATSYDRHMEAFIAAANPATVLELVASLKETRACLRHALALGCFTPGGSTEGWAKRILPKDAP